jgi:ABC-type microcin C transport system duplicated ATPase subunit YejF
MALASSPVLSLVILSGVKHLVDFKKRLILHFVQDDKKDVICALIFIHHQLYILHIQQHRSVMMAGVRAEQDTGHNNLSG